MYKTSYLTSKNYFTDESMTIDLEEKSDSNTIKLYGIERSIYIGKTKENITMKSIDYFQNGYGIRTYDVLLDSALLDDAIKDAILRSIIGKPRIMIYKDKYFPNETYQTFLKTLVSKTKGNLRLFEGYFNKKNKCCLGYREIRVDSIANFN